MLQVMIWTAMGMGTGWLARRAIRSGREFGLLGDLTTGWLGGVAGGWLFRRLGVVAPESAVGQAVAALAGAAVLLVGVRVLRRMTFERDEAAVPNGLAPGPDLEGRIRSLGQLERRIIDGLLTKRPTTRDPNEAFEAQITFGERVADYVARFGGSWSFIGLFFTAMASWMAMNEQMGRPFDPYPYILLNLVLSCLAALQAPVIMMSQNRQSAKDRSDAKHDYEVNVRAEMEIMALHAKLDALRDEEWVRLRRLVEEQQASLAEFRRRLDGLPRDEPSSQP